ncbi:MAG: GGDEF domain-containing protein [Rhodocyclaceae bacterium]|nr:GGDEF domain-containing protein [Rhodocyclaceae bacterium]
MIHVLKHVESITKHRDRTLLEVGVATALHELLKPLTVNVYTVQQAGTRTQLHRLTHAGADGVRYFDTDFERTDEVISVDRRADFQTCIAEERLVASPAPDSAHTTYCLPVAYDGKVAGLIEMVTDATLDDAQIDLTQSFITLYRNYLSLLDYSERDSLTGLLNRRTFDENLGKILASLRASAADHAALPGAERRDGATADAPHWLAVIDADHFKRINDKHGHLYGDEVLILLANLMRESFRNDDKLFRFGGEEFVAVLKPASFDDAHRVLERFRQSVEHYHFPQVGQVTISIGYAPLRAGDTASAVLGAADDAMYYAKAHGRNQVRAYPTLVAQGAIAPRRFTDEPSAL